MIKGEIRDGTNLLRHHADIVVVTKEERIVPLLAKGLRSRGLARKDP